MLTIQFEPYNRLTIDELYDLLALRNHVFITEQQCPYQDCDYRDQHAIHLLGYENTSLKAYLRILPHPENHAMSFGRVLSAVNVRKKGYGKQIINATLDYLNEHYPQQPIIISAQHYLLHFYEAFGFKSQGDIYNEDGIAHIRMELK